MHYDIINDPLEFYEKLAHDIRKAKREIILEIYKFDNDEIGVIIRDELIKAQGRGIKLKILIDYIGSSADYSFFKGLNDLRVFRRIRLKRILEGHKRDHRKLIIIDRKISYIGSANITQKCIEWQELMLRIEGMPLATEFSKIFFEMWRIHDKVHYITKDIRKTEKLEGLQILQDVPSLRRQYTKQAYTNLIQSAKEYIYIISPYFLPNRKIRRSLKKAAKQGVNVKIICPKKTDVPLADLFRGRYFAMLISKRIKLHEYNKMIHSKLIITENGFITGSSNLDYRSFAFQYELNILGHKKDLPQMHQDLRTYFLEELNDTETFDIEKYGRRGVIKKMIEAIVMRLRKYF